MKAERFYDERLTRQANKAVEMARNGFSRAEIEDEMDISALHLRVLLSRARRKGIDIPKAKCGRRNPGQTEARVVALRDRLWASGYKGRGSYSVIAERLGLHKGTVAVHLWRHNQRSKQGAAA